MSISVASSIAGVLVLIRRLHQEGAVNEEEKGQLKDAVISHNNQKLLDAFVHFVAAGNKEALVAALLGVLGTHNPHLAGTVEPTHQSVTKIESHPSDVDDVDADSEYNDQFAAGDRQVAYQAEGFHFEDDLHDDSASDAIDQEDEDYDGDEDDSHPVLSALNELDMMCIHHNVSEAGCGDVDLRDLWLAFEDDSMQSDGLTREQLRRCHLKLMNYHQNPRFLSAFLNKLYALLDRSRSGMVDFTELLCALALLCHGSEKQKLRFIFELLDFDSDGVIAMAELFRFLYAFSALLTVLRCPTLEEMSSSEDDEEQLAMVWEDAEDMFEVADIAGANIDVRAFAEWADNPVGLFDSVLESVFGSE
jgi:Ca2+-binding EF-hand superfamily protein